MRALVWNCRGVGSPLTVPQLKESVKLHSPELIFLSETKNRKDVMNKLGGLVDWQFCGGMSCKSVRRPERSFHTFRDFVNKNQLIDIGFEGIPWTWSNNWEEGKEIKERLDRVLCSRQWRKEFEKAKCLHIQNEASDHAMMLLDTDSCGRKWKRRFFFDRNWLKHKEVGELISREWGRQQDGSRCFKLHQKIKSCRFALLNWNRQRNNNAKNEIRELRQKWHANRIGKVRELKKRLEEAYKREEVFWGQKARIKWLQEGDKNTKFFHASVAERRRRNNISCLKKGDGTWCDSEQEVANEIQGYFQELFTSSNPQQIESTLRDIPLVITDQMNEMLVRPVSELEVRNAVFSLQPNKAPGPDGMTAAFFQHYWNVIKADLINAISSFFHSGQLLKAINETIITLIPKVDSPVLVSQFRPISLCNVVYRIISKILVLRLKPVLNCCISQNQSAFVPGRQIIDNVVIAHEFIHCLNNRRFGTNAFMALKLDMSKAYDRVEWLFVTHRQEISGLKIAKHSPALSHLFFADDTLIFCKANKEETAKVMKLLELYGKASGQIINAEKSSVFFSKNTKEGEKAEILDTLGGMMEAKQSKYLGLPLVYVWTFVKKWQNFGGGIGMILGKFIGWSGGSYLRLKVGGLGFRDLQQFNTAMLAKQLWRILTRPNLLVSRIVRGKYFRGSFFWEMNINAGDSWVWKSFLSARELLEEGVRLRVGDGKQIDIWEDKWLLDQEYGKIRSCKPQQCHIQRVHELISDGNWNVDMIREVFEEEDCQRILDIPISKCGGKDRLVWSFSNSGEYTVKTGYPVAKDLQRKKKGVCQQQGSSSRNEFKSGVWKLLWGLNVKHKLKHFVWKCLQRILPVNETVRRRTGQGDDRCCCCGERTETLEHIFFFCKHAELIWKVAPINWEGLNEYRYSFWHWWGSLMEAQVRKEGREHIELTINVLWQIWKSRNLIQFNREGRYPGLTSNEAVQEWLEFQNVSIVKMEDDEKGRGIERGPVKWEPPPENVICLNTDAAIKQIGAKASWGVVARCMEGKLRGAWAGCEDRRGIPIVEEARAIRHALVLAKQNGWRNIIIQTDCKRIVDQIRDGKLNDHLAGAVLFDIMALSKDFSSCLFSFVKREGNNVSHQLAKFALKLVSEIAWKESFPSWLSSIAKMDVGAFAPNLVSSVFK
ncbi:uncharacterized protein [Coffea arabica]|uniref:Reverse transcriptase n=1 Tax=Coffea arabica TaxID=13443 RepID=A0ABM4X701_COFAR